ncbi:MAG: hypothetical protein PHH17_03440, partial [Candidatus Pacebacteria bacterium]|nr:hypothetical protein [Candidatus Paceibacterota bacterium]MDD4897323.1 hypothetical protein [Candidatus Paceibacterota bacterium]MDD5446226.1 hypothetical protein [Candidatus Paceibacterota bacterium]
MIFSFISKIVDGVKGGVFAGLKGASDIGSSIVNVVKNITISTLKESTEFVKEGLDVPASVINGALTGVGEIGA